MGGDQQVLASRKYGIPALTSGYTVVVFRLLASWEESKKYIVADHWLYSTFCIMEYLIYRQLLVNLRKSFKQRAE